MREDKLYKLLRKKMLLVSCVPPQDIGPLTYYWRRVTPYVKTTPLKILLAAGFASSLVLWFLLGETLTYLAGFLQHGF